MSKEFIKKLKSIKSKDGLLNPDRAWVARNREQLISNIRQASSSNSLQANKFTKQFSNGLHVFVSNKVLSFARTSMAVVLVGVMAVGGWAASVSASYDSLPGEILYNVKMATESAELFVATVVGSEEDKVTTILKHASNRVEEYQRSETSEQATDAIDSLKKKIESSNESLIKMEEKSPVIAVAVAKVIEEKTEEILVSLAENKEELVEYIGTEEEEEIMSALSRELEGKVTEVEGLINDAGIKAIEVLIDKVDNEEVSEDVLTKEEVEDTINRKLDSVVFNVAELDVEIEETSQLMASSTVGGVEISTVSSTELSVYNSEGVIVETNVQDETVVIDTNEELEEDGTAVVAPEEVSVEEKIEIAEQKVEETNKKAEETVVEVEDFIEQNNLSAALEVIKELGGAKDETKVIVTEASDAVSEVVIVEEDVVEEVLTPDFVEVESIDTDEPVSEDVEVLTN